MGYTKYRSPWTADDLLSATSLNHIESQWDASKADADAHNHDDRYYTESEADDLFFTSTFYAGFDADTLDGSHLTDVLLEGFSTGTILLWPDSVASMPDGWALCDGTNGTPDLRDRFVVAAGNLYDPGDTGGPASWDGTIAPLGTVTVGGHVLTISEMPAHTHSYQEQHSGGTTGGTSPVFLMVAYETTRSVSTLPMSSGDSAHGHPGSTITFNGVDTRPPYKAIYYMMKIS